MFEAPDVSDLDIASCSDALVASIDAHRRLEAARLAMVVHWIDLHPPADSGGRWRSEAPVLPGATDAPQEASGQSVQSRSRGRPSRLGVQLGGEGTPRVAEFAVMELGVLLGTTTTSAERWARDALDLRHRLPAVWEDAMTGVTEVWKARKAASLTRFLSFDQARDVAPAVAEALRTLPFARALNVIEAQVIDADPAAHHARLQAQAAQRYVATARNDTMAGLRTLICQGSREEVARITGMVNQLARAIQLLGDPEPLESRRVKAMVLMANPALACLTLARAYPTSDQTADQTTEPPSEPGEVSSLGMAVLFGRLLQERGAQVLDRLRPRTVLFVHLAEEALAAGRGMARVRDLGPATLEELKGWVGHDHLTVRPVIDPANITPVDSYEIPAAMREAIELREPFEVFPYGTQGSHRADHDHTIPYVPLEEGGPPGQTHLGNLGPLSRRHHRAKTFGDFTCHQPLPGLYLWRVPSGHWYRCDHTGTHHLGRRTPDIIRHQQQPASMVEHAFLDALVALPTR